MSLVTCAAHGLNYDPEQATGCVLCRRTETPASTPWKPWLGVLLVVGILGALGGAYALSGHWAVIASQNEWAGETREAQAATANGGVLLSDITDGFELVVPVPRSGAAQLKRAWGIDVYMPATRRWSTPGGSYGTRPESAALDAFLLRVARVLRSYPVSFVSKSKFLRIMAIGGFHQLGVRVGMIAMGPYSAIVGNVTAGNSVSSIHHEFFHLTDFVLHGFPLNDSEWLGFNPREFSYAGLSLSVVEHAAAKRQLNALVALTSGYRGFVSRYSMANAAEDRADLFAAMMTAPAFVVERATVDPILRKKVEYLRRRTAELDPAMDARFWQARLQSDPSK